MGWPELSAASRSERRSGREWVRKSEKEVRFSVLERRSLREGESAVFCWNEGAMKKENERHRSVGNR